MRKLVIAAAALALLGCGDSTAPVATAVGTWNMVSINGTPLPYTVIQLGTYRAEIVSDRFVVNSNGTFTETLTVRETENGTVSTTTDSENGTWTQNNANITINHASGGTSTASISGNTITWSDGGSVAIFQRE